MEAPAAPGDVQATPRPELSGSKQAPPRKKASVSLHTDADLESNIKDQIASVSRPDLRLLGAAATGTQ